MSLTRRLSIESPWLRLSSAKDRLWLSPWITVVHHDCPHPALFFVDTRSYYIMRCGSYLDSQVDHSLFTSNVIMRSTCTQHASTPGRTNHHSCKNGGPSFIPWSFIMYTVYDTYMDQPYHASMDQSPATYHPIGPVTSQLGPIIIHLYCQTSKNQTSGKVLKIILVE